VADSETKADSEAHRAITLELPEENYGVKESLPPEPAAE
jgi:hypothetical protein